MSREYTTVLGSGTRSQNQDHPAFANNIPPGTYPGPAQRDQLRTRTGEGAVLLNPEDLSVFIGLRNQAISVTSTAVRLPTNPLEFRRALVIHNNSADILYIGASGVTTANGLPIIQNEKIAIDIQNNNNVTIWGISAGTSDVRIMELA